MLQTQAYQFQSLIGRLLNQHLKKTIKPQLRLSILIGSFKSDHLLMPFNMAKAPQITSNPKSTNIAIPQTSYPPFTSVIDT